MAEDTFVLSIDQGTTGTKVLLVDRSRAVRAQSYRQHTQYYPQSGWVEHDPEEIWQMVVEAVQEAVEQAGIRPEQIAAVGLANQGETVMIWDTDGNVPIERAVVWSCRRSLDIAERWSGDGDWERRVHEKTGLRIDPYFSATKIKWLIDEVPQARERLVQGKGRIGTLDSWLIGKMTGWQSFATDPSTAARTLLFNIRSGCWDEEILRYLDLDESWLAEVRPSVGMFGMTCPQRFAGIKAPVTVSLVDQPAALYGHLCIEPGMSKCTYGTGSFAYLNTGTAPLPAASRRLLSTIVWQRDGMYTYAVDGAIYAAGSAIEWGMKKLGCYRSIEELQTWSEAWVAGPRQEPKGMQPIFVPALGGLGAPFWQSSARGTFLGMSYDTGKEELARAILEGIAHRVADVLETMKRESGQELRALRVDGGPTRNPYLMQFQADLLGVPVEVPKQAETTSMGVVYLLGESLGWWAPKEHRQHLKIAKRYEPRMQPRERAALRSRWARAVQLLQEFHGQ